MFFPHFLGLGLFHCLNQAILAVTWLKVSVHKKLSVEYSNFSIFFTSGLFQLQAFKVSWGIEKEGKNRVNQLQPDFLAGDGDHSYICDSV
jgi:hypothetical protein